MRLLWNKVKTSNTRRINRGCRFSPRPFIRSQKQGPALVHAVRLCGSVLLLTLVQQLVHLRHLELAAPLFQRLCQNAFWVESLSGCSIKETKIDQINTTKRKKTRFVSPQRAGYEGYFIKNKTFFFHNKLDRKCAEKCLISWSNHHFRSSKALKIIYIFLISVTFTFL